MYVSVRTERTGMGTTSRDVSQKIYWLVACLPEGADGPDGPYRPDGPGDTDGGRYILQPLTDAHLPSGLVKNLPEADFIEHFLPDTECYETFIRPAADALAAYIDELPADEPFSVERYSPLALPFDQLRVLDGLLAVLRGRPGLVPREHDVPGLRAMLAGMSQLRMAPDFQNRVAGVAIGLRKRGDYAAAEYYLRMAPDFQNRVAGVAIGLRKRGDYAAAEYYYERALAVSGQEDRILFNLARVYYETGRAEKAADCLRRALEANPGLAVAEQFLRFVLTGARSADAGGVPGVTPSGKETP